IASAPLLRAASATAASLSMRRAASSRRAPSAAKARAVAAPMPDEAPVTKTIFPLRVMTLSYLTLAGFGAGFGAGFCTPLCHAILAHRPILAAEAGLLSLGKDFRQVVSKTESGSATRGGFTE